MPKDGPVSVEDPRIMLPVMVAMDGFITSHTQMVVDLPADDWQRERLGLA